MSKWIIGVIAALAIGSTIFYLDQQKKLSGDSGHDFLAYIPGDTLFYFNSKINEDWLTFVESMPINASSPSQQKQMQEVAKMFTSDETPNARFASFFLEPFLNGSIRSMKDLEASFGISIPGPYLLYSDGIYPVVRVNLSKPDVFWQHIESATNKSGWQYQTENIANTDVKTWQFDNPEGAPNTFRLAIHSKENIATISFISNLDDNTSVQQRLALVPHANSIKNTKEVDELKAKYSFQETWVSFIHFGRIAQNMLDLESGTLGKQLNALLPEEQKAQFNTSLTEECKQDYASLASSVPRLTMGYKKLAFENNQLAADFDIILEMTNEKVKNELNSLRGHIPSHSKIANDKIMATGFGINFTTVTPVLTNLWTQFVNADFKCDKLHKAQDQARKGNPAMLAMFLGMVQGIKGVGASVYDLEWNADMMLPNKFSALASIASENPQTIASMTSMLPVLAGLQIPADGSPVEVQLPIPLATKVFAAIKGKHLVVYTEDKIEQAKALESEALETNGLSSIAINYREFAKYANLAPTPGVSAAASCISNEEMRHIFSAMPMDLTMVTDSTNAGLEFRSSMTMDKVEPAKVTLVGQHKVEFLDESCQWQTAGQETISEDGSGMYFERDENDSCDIFTSEYTWKEDSGRIVFTPSKELSRETCAAALEEKELKPYDCYLMNASNTQFQCLFDAGTADAALYRYTRL